MTPGTASIRHLPPEVAKQINSSTAIPSLNSVVIGLAKNALDAGAQKLEIDVDYGRGSCTVEDDGYGIPPAEFSENGGLAKSHHTSKMDDCLTYGCNGTFLSSVAALSIMTITSHYRLNRSCATITLHHSRPAARMIPAPSYHQLSCREHGTRVSVRDLFGNMPVRVKQRFLDSKDPKHRDRYLESLNKYLVGLLLAWGSAVTIRVQTAPGAKVLHVRANEGQVPTRYGTPRTPSAVDIHIVRSVMSQAGHIGPLDRESWVHTSARSPLVSVEGAISVEPAPSKRAQFISIGINYIDNSPGNNILYDEINRLFATSSFGDDFEILDKAPPAAETHDDRRKQKEFTVQQLKGGGKGIDRWPMFFLRIAANTKEDPKHAGAGSIYQERNFLSVVTKVVTAMIIRFLEDHHFLTRRMSQNLQRRGTNGRNHKAGTDSIEGLSLAIPGQQGSQTPTSEPRSPRELLDPEQSQISKKSNTSTSTSTPRLIETKLPKFGINRDSCQVRAFASWQRIKSGNLKNLLELQHDSSAQIISKDSTVHNPNESSKRTSDTTSISKSPNGNNHVEDYLSEERRDLVLSSDSDNLIDLQVEPAVPEVSPTSQPAQKVDPCSNDDTVQWTNPFSKATLLVNARTGLVIPKIFNRGVVGGCAPLQGKTTIRRLTSSPNEDRLSLGISDSLPASDNVKWVNDILTSWKNPTFGISEERIPQISFDGLNMDSSANLSRRHHRCSYTDLHKSFMESSLSSQTKLSKQGLAASRVIAQVDRKFILVSIDNDKAEEGSENGRKEKKILALIDQHAADERIRVEKLLDELCTPSPLQDQQFACGTGYGGLHSAIMTTVLMKKIVFETNISERKLFVDHASRFADWGILYEISPPQHSSGSSASGKCRITVKTLPECIAEKCRIDPNSLIGIMRSEIWNCQHSGQTKASEAQAKNEKAAANWLSRIGDCPQGILEMLNSRACRSAIMFNDELSLEQCESLVQQLGACVFPFQCAHGRPSMIPLVDVSAQLASSNSDIVAFGTRRVARPDGEAEGSFAAAWKRRGENGLLS